jgi:CopG family nickel-responsive transcriptional regulator
MVEKESESQSKSDYQEKSENLERYSFTLPNNLIDEIEKIGNSLEMNRSMVVREALSNWVLENTKKLHLVGPGIGISSYIYDHHDTRVVGDIMRIQHNFDDLISSTTHIHLNHDKCFEIAILKGELGKLKVLNDTLRGIKGVSFFSGLLVPAP